MSDHLEDESAVASMSPWEARGSLIRSIAAPPGRRPGGAPRRGASRVVRPCDELAQLGAADAGRAARSCRARRLLDVHVRQLAAHAPVPAGVGGEVRGCRIDHRRRAHPRVRLRARPRATSWPQSSNLGVALPDRGRQRLRGLERVRQPLLAGGLHRRRRGQAPLPPLRRGRVRPDRDGDPAAARRRRREGPRHGPGHGRPAGVGGRRRLAFAAVARDLPRLRPEQRVRWPRMPRSTTARTSTREPATCRSTRGTSPATGRSPSTRPC